MIFYRIHRLWEWEMKMEKELTHEKMHELGIEHAHTHTHIDIHIHIHIHSLLGL